MKSKKQTQAKEARKAITKVMAAEKTKIRGDGRQIADLEKAIRKVKKSPGADSLLKVKSAQNTQAIESKFVQLLGTKEEQEIAWLMALFDPEAYAARVPITQVTGAVQVDLFRQTQYAPVTICSQRFAWVGCFPDGWNAVTAAGNALAETYLMGPSSNTTTCITYTNSLYNQEYAPPAGTPLAGLTGVSTVSNVSCSPDFQVGEEGTEYIMVGNKLSLQVEELPGATADQVWSGRVLAARTLDPERYPLTGLTISQLEALVTTQDAQVAFVEYRITVDGMFVPIGPAGAVPVPEISLVSLPLAKEAYVWRRILNAADDNQAPWAVTYTIPYADIAFFIEGPVDCTFQARSTRLYQTERYPSNRVVSQPAPGVASDVSHLKAAEHNWRGDRAGKIPSVPGYYNGGSPNGFIFPSAAKARSIRKNRPRARLSPLALVSRSVGAAPQLKKTASARNPSVLLHEYDARPTVRRKPHPLAYSSPPVSLQKAVPHLNRTCGAQIHPALAPLAVLSAASENPGFWHQMATAGIGALKSQLCDPKMAQLAVAHGPDAVEAASEDPGFSWSGFFSGLWDVVSTVGPAILGMLL